ncbi:MAG: hypothetical protein COA84_15965 [Robiginitomaculum sp.]|nr:MAG: hypothetical protein COA84_15965 [Robiginitomaculum sp.]
MSQDIAIALWHLSCELDQLNIATHYYSNLAPTPQHYQEQWGYFGRESNDLNAIFNRLSAHLKVIGITPTPPDAVNRPDNDDDEIPY